VPNDDDDATNRRKQLETESQPITFVTFVMDYPFVTVIVGFFILAICSILAVSLGYFKYDAISYRDMLIWDNPIVINWDKQVVAREYLIKNGGITDHTKVRSQPN